MGFSRWLLPMMRRRATAAGLASLASSLLFCVPSLLTQDLISRDTRAPTPHRDRQAMAGKNLKKPTSAKADSIKEETPTTTRRRIKEEPGTAEGGNNSATNNKRKAAATAATAAESNERGAAGRHCAVGFRSGTEGCGKHRSGLLSKPPLLHVIALIHPTLPHINHSPASIHALPSHGRGQRQR